MQRNQAGPGTLRSGKSLRQVKIFESASASALAAIEEQGRWRNCAKGVEIIRHQDASNDLVCILSGAARVNIYSSTGRMVTFRDIGPGDFVGELSAIDGAPRSAVIEALEPCTVVYLSSSAFWNILQSDPTVLKYSFPNFLAALSGDLCGFLADEWLYQGNHRLTLVGDFSAGGTTLGWSAHGNVFDPSGDLFRYTEAQTAVVEKDGTVRFLNEDIRVHRIGRK